MPDIQFITTVHIPDDAVDEDGRIIGSEEWTHARENPDHPQIRQHGTEPWTEGREPVEHYAARMLVAYCPASNWGITATTKIKRTSQ